MKGGFLIAPERGFLPGQDFSVAGILVSVSVSTTILGVEVTRLRPHRQLAREGAVVPTQGCLALRLTHHPSPLAVSRMQTEPSHPRGLRLPGWRGRESTCYHRLPPPLPRLLLATFLAKPPLIRRFC